MNAKDTVSAKLAECYVTVDGNRYNFMQIQNLVMDKWNKLEKVLNMAYL